MRRQCVQSDRDAQHAGARDEYVRKTERHRKELAADTAKHEVRGVVNAVHFGVVQLEAPDDVTGPC